MLSTHRLKILHRFAALGSITATAAALGYSASAISQQLSTLEREAGVALLERTAHKAILTDAGRELAGHATTILAAVEAAHSGMHARAGTIAGDVALSCIPELAADLAPHLADLQRTHADLRITARQTGSSAAYSAVLDGTTDVAVIDDWTGGAAAAGTGLAVHRLRRDRIVLALPDGHPEAARRGPVTPARLRELVATETWLCAPIGQQSRRAGDDRLAALDAVPARRWEFEGLPVLAALVDGGAGIALLPDTDVAGRPGVAVRPLTPAMYRIIVAVTRTSRLRDPATAACLTAAGHAVRGARRQ